MKKIIFSFLFLAVFSSSSIAAEKDYKICSIAGFFWGTQQKFLHGVAFRILGKQQISIGDPICDAAWKKGIEIAEHFSKSSQARNVLDKVILDQAVGFQTQVYDAVISNMNYK